MCCAVFRSWCSWVLNVWCWNRFIHAECAASNFMRSFFHRTIRRRRFIVYSRLNLISASCRLVSQNADTDCDALWLAAEPTSPSQSRLCLYCEQGLNCLGWGFTAPPAKCLEEHFSLPMQLWRIFSKGHLQFVQDLLQIRCVDDLNSTNT